MTYSTIVSVKRITYSVLAAALVAMAAPTRPVQEFPTSAGAVMITPINHASLMIEGGGNGFTVRALLSRSFGKNITFVDNLSQIATAGLHELVTVLNASDRAAHQGKAA